uniref:EF-hand domain-containing protein n=1 Tax=Heterosigma akashiwo TaxID=2829 RepID=A0A6V3E2V9_HETAK|mmetsp:Transcript_14963/g.20675  ORF Transcript_14963/g.20675 Transcript_14963/m.20675 type:complete len:243 (-) Transcript_14963:148-876(-)|eukprot:CAMPEP_0194584140 /NCGR_PEP_ID=MMETSP0292-20121207/16843_1 /TAXON_ID=39354 /ORGANISM="Heterosigma akashiwo, Strain CCMP2393" /LENGTH=242 /DNA_ID=CAMNT_0039439067 /DNA_START=67 /DNA_END=795 /DNA_ORIENTATION=-
MGAAASALGSGASEDVKTFVDCFIAMAAQTPEGKAARRQGWMAADPNGNGIASLAEIDGWIQKTLLFDFGENQDEADRLWKLFRPCYIRAFNDAKDIGRDRAVAGTNASTDDYVQKGEFRLMNAYLCIYAVMFDAFALIDGGGPGTDAHDDRRMSLEEWTAGYDKVKDHGFVGLAGIADEASEDSIESIFAQMDADGKGMVLLNEWCRWLEKKEQEAGTPIGQMLAIGDGPEQSAGAALPQA